MQGLQLAEDYFVSCGLPMLQRSFPGIVDRVAVGLVGPGSECYGFDDELSRDHDWGPGFCLWLRDDDTAQYGRALQDAYRLLPEDFAGFGPRRVSPGEEGRLGVMTIAGFYGRYIGLDRPPETLREWLALPEQALSVCTNGRVFHDPCGCFSEWRQKLLAFYPEDIRRKKIAARCMSMAQTGQYNLARSLKRDEPFAARYAEQQFCYELMQTVFLLNRRYAPFYKWLHRATLSLPVLGQTVHRQVCTLLHSDHGEEKVALIEQLCGLIAAELRRQELSDSSSTFLLDHGPRVQARISDSELRNHFKPLT